MSAAPRIFKRPELVRRAEATRFLWGDEESHHVSDIIYGRGTRISGLIFALRPGERFGASETWRPLYDQHRFYYVVQGSLAIHDPESGEVALAGPGEAVTWQGSRYHFGYNFGGEETLVLDWYAPQERPPDVPEIEVSPSKRPLRETLPGRLDLLGSWPAARARSQREAFEEGGIVCVGPADALHLVQGAEAPMLVSILASSAELTAGTLSLLPGQMSDPEAHPGDEVLFALEGPLHVLLPEDGSWFDLRPLDCLFLPEGTEHRYCSYGDRPSRAAFCVVPRFR